MSEEIHKKAVKESKKRDISFSKFCRISLIKQIEPEKTLDPRKE